MTKSKLKLKFKRGGGNVRNGNEQPMDKSNPHLTQTKGQLSSEKQPVTPELRKQASNTNSGIESNSEIRENVEIKRKDQC